MSKVELSEEAKKVIKVYVDRGAFAMAQIVIKHIHQFDLESVGVDTLMKLYEEEFHVANT